MKNFNGEVLFLDRADINIMGSGDAAFASDGKVEAKIMGSGNVTVTGRLGSENLDGRPPCFFSTLDVMMVSA